MINADFKLSLSQCFEGSFVNRTQNSSKNPKPFWRLRVGRGSAVHPPSNGEGLRDIWYNMSRILDTRFYIWFIMRLYYKMRQILLQNATEFSYKMRLVFYYNMRQFYYKIQQFHYSMRQLLQNATFIINCDSTNTFQYLQLWIKFFKILSCMNMIYCSLRY